jgi:hypothetical protein
MPIVSASNGIRPEYRALAVIQLNKSVTPTEINDCVGTGDYAAKYISFLRNRFGFTFTIQKDGRNVVSYTCVDEPANVADLRSQKPKVKGAKPAKKQIADAQAAKSFKLKPGTKPVKKVRITKAMQQEVAAKVAKTDAEIKAANLEKMKAVSAKLAKKRSKSKKIIDVVENELGSTGEISNSYTVDAGWDSTEGLDIKRLVA